MPRAGSLWAQNVPVTQPEPDPTPEVDAPPVTARSLTLSVALVATALVVAAAAVLPVPYVVSAPGPTWDTLGEDDGTPLVAVSGAPTHEPSGRLLLTTVSVSGGPGRTVGLLEMLQGWVDGTRSVRPVESVFGPTQTREEIQERNQASMISSQENATVAALEELGHEVPTVLEVADVVDGTGSVGVVEPGDVVVALDGVDLVSFSDLSAQMDDVTAGDAVTLTVERDGEPVDLTVETTAAEDGRALLGVLIDPEFDFPVDVEIQIEDVGGPSAGMMFALAVIDLLTEEDEVGGETIAGTGTMDLAGAVGPIGGIRQKMAGAARDGATWFLAPAGNCDEVVGHVPDGLTVVRVATLGGARDAVEAIGAGRGDGLPSC